MHPNLRNLVTTLLTFFAILGSAEASYIYTYRTSANNPLQGAGGDNYISLQFYLPFQLAPNIAYNISADAGPGVISYWAASDSLLGIFLEGQNTPVTITPQPGSIEGGALHACTGLETCFGGALLTDDHGNINFWNLVANDSYAAPYLTFISYSNNILGSIDGLGSTIAGGQNLQLNTLNLAPGSWTMTEGQPPNPTSIPEPESLPLIATALISLGLVHLARINILNDRKYQAKTRQGEA